MSYLQRRANRYEFRYRLPDDLAGRPTPVDLPVSLSVLVSADGQRWKREVVRSLHTNDPKLANRKVLPHIAEMQVAIEEARRFLREGPSAVALEPEQVQRLAAEHEHKIVSGDLAIRREGIGLDLAAGVLQPDGQGMTEQDIDFYRFVVGQLGDEVLERSVRMRSDTELKARVDAALARQGVQVSPQAPFRREVEIAFMAAEQRAFATIKARLAGDHSPPPTSPPPTPQVQTRHPLLALTLSQALTMWAGGGGRGAKKPRDRTHDEAATAVRLFRELHGDLPIAQSQRRTHASSGTPSPGPRRHCPIPCAPYPYQHC